MLLQLNIVESRYYSQEFTVILFSRTSNAIRVSNWGKIDRLIIKETGKIRKVLKD